MKALIFLCVVTGAALVYLMSVASSNNELFAKNYQLLLYLGVGLAVGLASLVSFQFLQRSIESWFDVRIDESLERGLKLARNAIENSLRDLEKKTESMATS